MLDFRDVSKSFGSVRAVEAVTLSVPRGRTTVLIGPSGCGKSTLLRLTMGLIFPDRGSVRFEGGEVGPGNALQLRRRMGYVIQEGGLFPHLTARGNVALMARYLGWEEEAIATRIGELCALTRFPQDAIDRYPAELSGGQRQRVGLMRALMLDPDVLLLDEPLAALDPMIRADLQGDLKRIFRALAKTVILVTHDMHEAGVFADLIVLLRDGRIVQDGTLVELLERPAGPFVERFVTAQKALLGAPGEPAG
jgi:osmoprotectant transport system ATP-binding protein